jgi:hypothetical protein
MLRQQGFDPLPMKAGFLLSDELEKIHTLLAGISGTEQHELPVPDEMKPMVRSIRLFKPRSLHSS